MKDNLGYDKIVQDIEDMIVYPGCKKFDHDCLDDCEKMIVSFSNLVRKKYAQSSEKGISFADPGVEKYIYKRKHKNREFAFVFSFQIDNNSQKISIELVDPTKLKAQVKKRRSPR